MKKVGVLLPISSLPSKYGIGDFSLDAYKFVDFLVKSGVDYWQILPLVPIDDTYSPYQSCSTFAGNYLFIDLQGLYIDKLLTQEEIDSYEWTDGNKINYEQVKKNKEKLLWKAYLRYIERDEWDIYYTNFIANNRYWLIPYANYMSEKEGKHTSYYIFEQYIFDRQWNNLKTYANSMGIKIVGDLPIYVSADSSDVEYNKDLFKIKNGKLESVAGCPGDRFSEEGQVWGNPLYNWIEHEKTNYKWWKARIKRCFELYDVLRLDHFKGFDEYFSIPHGKEPKYGHWEKAPGMKIFDSLKEEFGELNIIAEDLGVASASLDRLLEDTGFPGMKVLQFAFDYDLNNFHLPNNYKTSNCVCYTGTHDNNTIKGWWNDELKHDINKQNYIRSITWKPIIEETICKDMIEFALQSKANTVIIPMQDILELGSESRINTPGTTENNWNWRMQENTLTKEIENTFKHLIEKYNK